MKKSLAFRMKHQVGLKRHAVQIIENDDGFFAYKFTEQKLAREALTGDDE